MENKMAIIIYEKKELFMDTIKWTLIKIVWHRLENKWPTEWDRFI